MRIHHCYDWKTFDQLCEMKMFESWLYKVIVMLPYCYPLRAHHKDVEMKYNNTNRISTLATVILGALWNNKVYFGDRVPKKTEKCKPTDIPNFPFDIIQKVEHLLVLRGRSVRSNRNRSNPKRQKIKRGEKKSQKTQPKKSKKNNSVESVEEERVDTGLDNEENAEDSGDNFDVILTFNDKVLI